METYNSLLKVLPSRSISLGVDQDEQYDNVISKQNYGTLAPKTSVELY